MSILHIPLFASPIPRTLGVGFHNVGNEGVLRAWNETMIKYVQHYCGERCGHLPLNARNIRAVVSLPTAEIQAQMTYLSALFGKDVTPTTFDELKMEKGKTPELVPLVVPYINVPEIETRLQNELGAESWGLPGKMTHVLKNKPSFYQSVTKFAPNAFDPPDYTIASMYEVAREAERFVRRVEDVYKKAGVAEAYPLGVMLRAAEEDGSYGCGWAHENAGGIMVVQDRDADHPNYYTPCAEALAVLPTHLAATINLPQE